MNFCEDCERMVPDDEVMDFAKHFGKATSDVNKLVFKLNNPNNDSRRHVYKQTVNAYKNQAPGTIGYCPEVETVWCGKVREPTDYEYFIYQTCNPDANTGTKSPSKPRRTRRR